MYFVSTGRSLLSSTDLMYWSYAAGVGEEGDGIVNSFVQMNQHVALASRDDEDDPGLFYSRYKVELKDDTAQFNAESAYAVYEQH